jgi:hypothetical protein
LIFFVFDKTGLGLVSSEKKIENFSKIDKSTKLIDKLIDKSKK